MFVARPTKFPDKNKRIREILVHLTIWQSAKIIQRRYEFAKKKSWKGPEKSREGFNTNINSITFLKDRKILHLEQFSEEKKWMPVNLSDYNLF